MRCVLCDGSIERELLVLHQTEECLQRLLACSYCEFPVAAIDWDAHVVSIPQGLNADVLNIWLNRLTKYIS